MTALHPWEYGLAFVAALVTALLATPVALRAARRWSFFDHPGAIKAQSSPVPYLGGAAIVFAFSAVVMIGALVRPPVSRLHTVEVLFAIALGLSVLGLLDDLRGLGPWLRLACEAAAGVGVWYTGTRAQLLDAAPLDAAVTVLWVVGVTNAFNMLDNMDGLSAGVAAIAAAFFFVVALLNGQFLVATLAIALAGCALGFLRHNFHPARIYMGDAGSLFLGFLLAVLALRLRTDARARISFVVPLLVLGVALFDATLVTVTRVMHRRNPLSGGRDHTSHRLVFVGIPVPAAVSLIYGFSVALGWLAVIASRVDRTTSFLVLGLAVAVALLLGVLLSVVPVYESSRRRHLMIREVQPHEEPPAHRVPA